MKKINIVISIIFLSALLVTIGNTSEHEHRKSGEYYEHGERHENKFYGTVKKIPENLIGIWLVDDRYIHVTKDTYIEREYGQPGVGSYVEVEGSYIENTFIARKIEVKGKNK